MFIPRATDRTLSDAVAVLLASAVASSATMGLYASDTLFSVALFGADLSLSGTVATAIGLGSTVLSVGLAAAAWAFRQSHRR